MLDNFYSPYDSKVIELFNKSGAVNLGKTNMDEFAMDHLMKHLTMAK